MVVCRTTDGGVTWSSSGLGTNHYTDWPVAPRAELAINEPLHDLGWGRTWRKVGVRRQSFEKEGSAGRAPGALAEFALA